MSSPVLNSGVSSQESLTQQQIRLLELQLQELLDMEELEREQASLGTDFSGDGSSLAQIQLQIQQVRQQIQYQQAQLLALKPSSVLPAASMSPRSPDRFSLQKSPEPTETKDYDPFGSEDDEQTKPLRDPRDTKDYDPFQSTSPLRNESQPKKDIDVSKLLGNLGGILASLNKASPQPQPQPQPQVLVQPQVQPQAQSLEQQKINKIQFEQQLQVSLQQSIDALREFVATIGQQPTIQNLFMEQQLLQKQQFLLQQAALYLQLHAGTYEVLELSLKQLLQVQQIQQQQLQQKLINELQNFQIHPHLAAPLALQLHPQLQQQFQQQLQLQQQVQLQLLLVSGNLSPQQQQQLQQQLSGDLSNDIRMNQDRNDSRNDRNYRDDRYQDRNDFRNDRNYRDDKGRNYPDDRYQDRNDSRNDRNYRDDKGRNFGPNRNGPQGGSDRYPPNRNDDRFATDNRNFDRHDSRSNFNQDSRNFNRNSDGPPQDRMKDRNQPPPNQRNPFPPRDGPQKGPQDSRSQEQNRTNRNLPPNLSHVDFEKDLHMTPGGTLKSRKDDSRSNQENDDAFLDKIMSAENKGSSEKKRAPTVSSASPVANKRKFENVSKDQVKIEKVQPTDKDGTQLPLKKKFRSDTPTGVKIEEKPDPTTKKVPTSSLMSNVSRAVNIESKLGKIKNLSVPKTISKTFSGNDLSNLPSISTGVKVKPQPKENEVKSPRKSSSSSEESSSSEDDTAQIAKDLVEKEKREKEKEKKMKEKEKEIKKKEKEKLAKEKQEKKDRKKRNAEKRAKKEKRREKEREKEKKGKKKIVHKNAGIPIGTVVSVWFADKKKYFVGKITERDDYEEVESNIVDSYKITWGNGKSEYVSLDEKDNTKDTSNSDRWNIGRNVDAKATKKKAQPQPKKAADEESSSALTDEGSSDSSSTSESESSASSSEEEKSSNKETQNADEKKKKNKKEMKETEVVQALKIESQPEEKKANEDEQEIKVENEPLEDMKVDEVKKEQTEMNTSAVEKGENIMQVEDMTVDVSNLEAGALADGADVDADPDQSEFMKSVHALKDGGSLYDRVKRLKKEEKDK